MRVRNKFFPLEQTTLTKEAKTFIKVLPPNKSMHFPEIPELHVCDINDNGHEYNSKEDESVTMEIFFVSSPM